MTAVRRPRIILADDHTLVAEGLAQLLGTEFELAARVGNGRDAIRAVETLEPDVVLLDISMPVLNGIEAARQLLRRRPQLKILFLTMHADPDYLRTCLRLGVSGYILKSAAARELSAAIWRVLRGETYISSGAEEWMSSGKLADSGELTTRQREVLQLIAEGKAAKEIAQLLHITAKTVEFHKARIMEKLDLHTTADLTRYALRHGMVPGE